MEDAQQGKDAKKHPGGITMAGAVKKKIGLENV